ncbi:MAG: nitroreductase [Thermaerobacter sp.]|nr:nitroreductase [Thermaerobacter sp.]
MLVEEAIRSRASIKVFSEKPLVPEMIESFLDAAVWAPNHHLTEPWHFAVISSAMREALARVVRADMLEQAAELDLTLVEAKALKERKKLLSAPTIVAVYSDAGPDARTTRENFAASAAAAQNVLLMAHSSGVSGIWRTSVVYDLPGVRAALHVHEGAVFVGALFLGYSLQRAVKRRRTPARDKTYWLGLDDLEPKTGKSDEVRG